MRDAITTWCTVGSAAIIAMSFNIHHAVFLFLVIGLIPGTDITIPAGGLLLLYAVILMVTLTGVYLRTLNDKPLEPRQTPFLSRRRYTHAS